MTKKDKVYPSQEQPRFIVRFPDESLKDRLVEAAQKNKRSINSEVIDRLARSFNDDSPEGLDSLAATLTRSIASEIDKMLLDILKKESDKNGTSVGELVEDIINKKEVGNE